MAMAFTNGLQEIYTLVILLEIKGRVWEIMFGLKVGSIEGNGKMNVCMVLGD